MLLSPIKKNIVKFFRVDKLLICFNGPWNETIWAWLWLQLLFVGADSKWINQIAPAENLTWLQSAWKCFFFCPPSPIKTSIRWPSLFADFLSANSLIHIDKNGPKWQFHSQKWPFYLQIQGSWSKMMERIYRE